MKEIPPLYNVHPIGTDGELRPTCAGPFRHLEFARACAQELQSYPLRIKFDNLYAVEYVVVETVRRIVFTSLEESDD